MERQGKFDFGAFDSWITEELKQHEGLDDTLEMPAPWQDTMGERGILDTVIEPIVE